MTRASPRISRDVPQPVRRPKEGLRAKHLEFIRQLPCIGCGREPPCQPMHVRMSRHDLEKYNTMARKPDDKYTCPGCHHCHIECQHTKEGEPAFWARLGIDGLDVALKLWSVTGDLDAGRTVIFKARQRIALHQHQREIGG